ncbi:unnamed protein product [Enterobius vermicularis]|uniref:NADH-ubiquinone oxidoreductase B12 subunit n=1 Tax=Enterobius vermicularis TaxID=51028 RepID=A0A0N4VL02_ENTVE|nr:unnamed protein product [Enterobius vermicularis]
MVTAADETLSLFRQINRLASEGKWNSVTNAPCLPYYLNGEARDAFRKLVCRLAFSEHPEDFRIAFFKTNPGQFIKLTARLVVSFAAIFLGVAIYEFVVSEEKRLKYKYRHKHQHHAEEHHYSQDEREVGSYQYDCGAADVIDPVLYTSELKEDKEMRYVVRASRFFFRPHL